MYTYPTTVNATNYRLIPAGKFYTTRRSGGILGIVLHITAGLQDAGMRGDDDSAEGTVRWALGRRPEVSWHVGVDSNSIVPCLPASYTAWHAKGYNSRTFGIEISKTDVDWSDMPAAWVTATLTNAARALAPIVAKNSLPLVLRSKAQVDSAIAGNDPFGFVYHSSTSAGTRSDPGKNFPITRLFELIRAEIQGTAPAPTSYRLGDKGEAVKALQTRLNAHGATLTVDGSYGPATEAAVRTFQKSAGLSVDGIAGPQTIAALAKAPATTTPPPAPLITGKEPAMVLVQVKGLDEVYLSYGFARRHITPASALADWQRALRDQGGTGTVTKLDTVAQLDTFGPLDPPAPIATPEV